MNAKVWDPSLYDDTAAYVSRYGKDLLEEWLAPKKGETIIDLGCGTGELADRITQLGATVHGIDSSSSMVETAKAKYPNLSFEVADAKEFKVDQPVDAVFSNAALHWMTEPDPVLQSVSKSLKPGGRFIGEMGAQDNIATIIAAVNMAFVEIGQEPMPTIFPWYFPSLGEYTSLLEKHGFVVEKAVYFNRPTPLVNGAEGLKIWMQNFADPLLQPLEPEIREEVLERTIQFAEPALRDGDQWYADYVRLRFSAYKEE
ncbi:methyltransferase domain-containing protein [Geomicrobium sp. JCM 19039]|uniref:methyltransferase domain-containing protein n=1 Tax=Geomicrobium sp. JCM 19039 TaxID=1460636 RepID=UPI00045F3A2E|nr:methyltransferase domain-containing protein [Geomicrobium sp. JCM 19039]GAK13337.1 cyclopropane-fatty-acyl-phospholipid synthase [Geomicrobium sp. JCM 19039]